jgi:carbon starvation protein CstA
MEIGGIMNGQDEKKKKDDANSKLIGGLIVTGVGIVFLLSNMGYLPDMDELWPAFLIVVGLALIIGAFVKKNNND